MTSLGHGQGHRAQMTSLWIVTRGFRGVYAHDQGAVKAVTHMTGGPAASAGCCTADGCAALLKVAEIGLTAGFHDREGFTTENDIKVFAIMKSGQKYEVSGVQEAVVTVNAAAGRRLFHDHAGR